VKRKAQTINQSRKSTLTRRLTQKNSPAAEARSEVVSPAEWFKPWWRECSLFSLDLAHQNFMPSARAGLEPAFKWFWEPNRIPAWAYELVRRLVRTKVPAESERKVLQEMPPYPQLHPGCRQAIKAAIGEVYGWGPALLNRAGIDMRPFKYSEPIPPWSFDLQSGERTQLDIVRRWLRLQADAAGIPTRAGIRGKKSRNRNQTGNLGNWDLVELLERPLKTNPERRKRAIRHATKFKDRIIGVWQCFFSGREFLCPVPPADEIPGFTGKQFTQAQFRAAFRAAIKQSSAVKQSANR